VVDDIFRLKVAVDDLALVHVIQGLKCVFEDDFSEVLVEFAFFTQKSIQLSAGAEFHDQVDISFIAEKCIELDNVGVIEKSLDLDFSYQLNHQFMIDVRLVDALDRHHKPSLDMPE
jgi:hypothetical protein